jgi:hypothetical protein
MGKHLNIFYSEWSETRCFIAVFNPSLGLRKLRENGVGLKFNGTHHLLVCAADVNVLGEYEKGSGCGSY